MTCIDHAVETHSMQLNTCNVSWSESRAVSRQRRRRVFALWLSSMCMCMYAGAGTRGRWRWARRCCTRTSRRRLVRKWHAGRATCGWCPTASACRTQPHRWPSYSSSLPVSLFLLRLPSLSVSSLKPALAAPSSSSRPLSEWHLHSFLRTLCVKFDVF